MKRLRCGQWLRVEFLDHVEDGSAALAFAVYGELARIDRQTLSIDCWCYADHRTPHDENEKRYTILRSTIRKITHLVPA